MYGSADRQEYQEILGQLNQDVESGICAKQLAAGDVAWKCLDCENDETAVQCGECFDSADHAGHRIQLKRNVGGCCDCGDGDAWKPQGNCKKHKGIKNQIPSEILTKLPESIRRSGHSVFTSVIKELKTRCMHL